MEQVPQGSERSTLFSKLAILIVVMILGVAMFGEKGVVRLVKLMRERENLAEQVEQLKQENARLKHQIEALRSDHRYLEQMARKELGMVREDEVVFQFRPAQERAEDTSDSATGEH